MSFQVTKRSYSSKNVSSPDCAAATDSRYAANLLFPGYPGTADRRWHRLADRRCTRFRSFACVWTLGTLVLVRRRLPDHLPLAVSAVRRVRVSRHESKLGRPHHGARRGRVLQPVCGAGRARPGRKRGGSLFDRLTKLTFERRGGSVRPATRRALLCR